MKHQQKARRRLDARCQSFEVSKSAKGSGGNTDGYRRPGSLNRHKSFSLKRKQ